MTDVGTLTLAEFLLARIAEDEAVATTADCTYPGPWRYKLTGSLLDAIGKPVIYDDSVDVDFAPLLAAWNPARVLAECEAKRRIVESRPAIAVPLPEVHEEVKRQREYVLRLLALPYADDPDYRQEWRP